MVSGLKAFAIAESLKKLTIRQAVEAEMTGLPFATQVFFFGMITSFNNSVILSGAINLIGCLRRLCLSTLESGAQVSQQICVLLFRLILVTNLLLWFAPCISDRNTFRQVGPSTRQSTTPSLAGSSTSTVKSRRRSDVSSIALPKRSAVGCSSTVGR